jgi:hypothetical protein
VNEEATTPSSGDQQAQIAELQKPLDDGRIDAAEYERRRWQIAVPGAHWPEEAEGDDWSTPARGDIDDDDEGTPHTPTQWMIAFVICIVLGGLSGYAIEADWSGVVIGAVIMGGALFLIDVVKAN